MLIVVNSLPKCGSTWLHNYVERCLTACGHPPALEAVAGFSTQLNHRANPGSLEREALAPLLDAAREHTFGVKAHVPPNPFLLAALRRDECKSVFVIRRPKDIVVSALAYGAFCRANEWPEPYAGLHTPEDAAAFVSEFIDWAAAWLAEMPDVVVRYENIFAADRAAQLMMQLAPQTSGVAASILDEMRPAKLSQEDRDWMRVNLQKYPPLNAPVERRAEEWGRRLGYE